MSTRVSAFGSTLRRWRRERGLSQLELAARANTTPRYVSFVETGRSRPGRDVVLRLAEAMDVPMAGRNQMLIAAGLPATFAHTQLDEPAMAPILRIVDRLFAQHEPYPAFLIGPGFRMLRANDGGERFMPGLLLMTPEQRIDMWFGPGPFRQMVENWQEMIWMGVEALRRELTRAPDPDLEALVRRAEAYARAVPRPDLAPELPVVCPRFRLGDRVIRTITTVMRFDNAVDIGAADLRVELMFPADDEADAYFEELAGRTDA